MPTTATTTMVQLELWPWMPRGRCPVCWAKAPNFMTCEKCRQRREVLLTVREPGWLEVRAQRAAAASTAERQRQAAELAIAARRDRLRALGRPVRVALVGCGAKKKPGRHPARALYTGSLFRAALEHAERTADETYILSGFHGVVRPDEELESYDRSLADLSYRECDGWRARVCSSLRALYRGFDVELTVYAGHEYASRVAGLAVSEERFVSPFTASLPLRGLGVGERLGWFRKQRELAGVAAPARAKAARSPAPPPPASVASTSPHVTARARSLTTASAAAKSNKAHGSTIAVSVGGYVARAGQVVKASTLGAGELGELDAQRLAAAPPAGVRVRLLAHGACAERVITVERRRGAGYCPACNLWVPMYREGATSAPCRTCRKRSDLAGLADGRCAACVKRIAARAAERLERDRERAAEQQRRDAAKRQRQYDRDQRERYYDRLNRQAAEHMAADPKVRAQNFSTHIGRYSIFAGRVFSSEQSKELEAYERETMLTRQKSTCGAGAPG